MYKMQQILFWSGYDSYMLFEYVFLTIHNTLSRCILHIVPG